MDRRTFGRTVAGISLASSAWGARPVADRLRVAVIGHTGRGNYGHGLDLVWQRVEETEIVAVADPEPDGLKKKLAQLDLAQAAGYADYRHMLASVKPDIVVVCPRHADQHHDMILAAVEGGATGIYVEKPFVRTPAEADAVVRACESGNVKLAIAHRNRYHPTLPTIQRLIDEGRIGQLLEIRGRGKEDHRSGAEDLWVLGSHVLNLFTYFGGTPVRCSAVMQKDGKRVTREDVYPGNEGLGPLAGNGLHARYEFANGLIGYFDSVAKEQAKSHGFGLRLVGSEGTIAIGVDHLTLAHYLPGDPLMVTEPTVRWLPISTAGIDMPEPIADLAAMVAHHGYPARDLLSAIQQDRQPLCNMHEAALTVEMIGAVFQSHRRDSRAVTLPLRFRGNALAQL